MRPWTIELINAGLAIGNVVYMYYKDHFKRVRPSFLCPGLVPPFGPPAHPAFPSGHSFLGHLIALFLLEIPAIAERYGIFAAADGSPGTRPAQNSLQGRGEVDSPLLWLAQRLAKTGNASESTIHRTPAEAGISRPGCGGRCCARPRPIGSSVRP